MELDFEFRRNLHDTILLLGGKQEVAELLIKSLDKPPTIDDLKLLQGYNIDLFNDAKSRLRNLNKLTIKTTTANGE